MKHHKGFTLIEVVIVATFLVVLIGAAAVAVARDSETARVIMAPMGPELRVNGVMERLASELRMAGEFAEDLDHDGAMDTGEDTNANGVLDADWNLADGVVGQDNLSFNRRIDEFDIDGNLIVSGIYSRRVTYRLDGDSLVREWERSREDGTVEELQTVIARGVNAIRFSRSGKVVTFAIDITIPSEQYEDTVRTCTSQIWLRN